MHKTVMTALEVRPQAALHTFDISNAHNEQERAAMIIAVRRYVPDLAPWAEPWLRVKTHHVCHLPGAAPIVLAKERGGDQGDPLITAVFPLTFRAVVEVTEQAARVVDPEATAYAYQDDLDLVATPEARAAARTAYVAGCAANVVKQPRSKTTA